MKPIKGFEDYYITEDGKVISFKMKNPKVLKTFKSSNGNYESIKLSSKSITYHKLIHRLVAEAFIDNPKNLPEIHHKDHNTFNNHKNNLVWCTRKENLQYSYNVLSPVRNFINCSIYTKNSNQLIGKFKSKKEAARYAATELGCNFNSMYRYLQNKNYKIV